MTNLGEFRAGLEPFLASDDARPFVCQGSPLACRSFIVGLNAATRLSRPFSSYWSDTDGFDRDRFDADYREARPGAARGNRRRIEAIARRMGPCLETNLYAAPSRKARQLTKADRHNPIICYLFRTIKPQLIFVHSKEPIDFFIECTACNDFIAAPRRVRWQGHSFWLFGRPGPLFTWAIDEAANCGSRLEGYLQQ